MKRLALFFALFAANAFGAERVIINPDSNGDLKLKVNKGGTVTDVISVAGSTAAVSITGATDASSPGAGIVGETITVQPNTVGNATVTADTVVDSWTSGTNELVLTAGSWEVTVKAGVYLNATSAGFEAGSVHLYNVTDAAIVSNSSMGFATQAAASGSYAWTLHSRVIVRISSSKTYRLRHQLNNSAAGATAQLYGSNSPSGSGNVLQTTITAVRIAR